MNVSEWVILYNNIDVENFKTLTLGNGARTAKTANEALHKFSILLNVVLFNNMESEQHREDVNYKKRNQIDNISNEDADDGYDNI